MAITSILAADLRPDMTLIRLDHGRRTVLDVAPVFNDESRLAVTAIRKGQTSVHLFDRTDTVDIEVPDPEPAPKPADLLKQTLEDTIAAVLVDRQIMPELRAAEEFDEAGFGRVIRDGQELVEAIAEGITDALHLRAGGRLVDDNGMSEPTEAFHPIDGQLIVD